MTTCTIIGIIVHCLITAPPLTPAQAAAKMTAPFAYRAPVVDPPPGMFCCYAPVTRFLMPRRLDGTPMRWPVQTYGQRYDTRSNTVRPGGQRGSQARRNPR